LAFALVGTSAGGQDPAPPCPAGTPIVPGSFQFIAEPSGDATQSLTATHQGTVIFKAGDDSALSLPDPAIHITGPPGLALTPTNPGDTTSFDFVPATPGTLTFTATWSQNEQADGPTCTDTTSATLTATAPTLARASQSLTYSIGHYPGKPGSFNEFVLTALVKSAPTTGDESPIRLTVRTVAKQRSPSAKAPATTLTFDPVHSPSRGVRVSHGLASLSGSPFGDDPGIYQFKIGVFARPAHRRGRTRRGVAITLSQGSRTLRKYHFATKCDSAGHGSLECYPQP
jgi:hypothetical protein